MSTGDMISQLFMEKKTLNDWNYMRTFRFGALGFVVVAPTLRNWFNTLDHIVAKNQSNLKRGLKKVCIHQIFFTAPYNLVISYLTLFIHGQKHDQIVKILNRDFLGLLKHSCLFWAPAQMINFSIVPIKHQVTYSQSVALIWNTYLSWLLNKDIK